MPPSPPSLITTRIALTHAVLTLIHPSISHNSPFPLPVHLPAELHTLIRTHLRIHIARSLLASLHRSLHSTLSTLCDDCKSYYAHVFGQRVVDWPVIRAGRGCHCDDIGLQLPRWGTNDGCNEPNFELRSLVGDKEPPAYFLAHVQHTLAAYISVDPHFPYADMSVTASADLDALLSRVLSTFRCRLVPAPATRKWEVDDDVFIIPFFRPSDCEYSSSLLCRLQLELELPIHTDLLAHSSLHPMKAITRYHSNSISASLISFIVATFTAPIAFAFALGYISAYIQPAK
ncbi:hypothetical protein PAXRUDRAFT_29396 [Paxillus rubicundulus Ve08.2h10]|uniref:Uncharacterized protein n=1 Tax=Paxillus rubicundulus Ve08.2h10 TaxID=930991 RepID=A0A0D0DYU2_9AGAM|nr:hypothetical protein PAXRUDRAFT_29396 [Paxillus rubicundulus Ve08.2h10]